MELKGIIFDLDGTLGNTIPICLEAMGTALRRTTGVVYSPRQIEELFGPTEQGILAKIIGDGWEEAAEILYAEYERIHPEHCTAPFPGIAEMLDLLDLREIRAGIVTGKGARTAAISLRHMGLEGRFNPVETGSDDGPVKPELIQKVLRVWGLEPSTVAYVGDAPSDVDSAREAGVAPVAAAWADTTDAAGIAARGPEKLFASVDEFVEWIKLSASLP